MVLSKRECVRYVDGTVECFRGGFWYTEKGVIIKWSILCGILIFFGLWFVGGYIHAKSRMKKGLPLLGYHRWLVPYSTRRKYNQAPQNHFAFYQQRQQPYGAAPAQRPDGTFYPEPPPLYNSDAPPGYYAPPAAKPANQSHVGGMEMPPYPPPQQQGAQQSGFVGGNAGDAESGQGGHVPSPPLPERPQAAKVALGKIMGRFKR